MTTTDAACNPVVFLDNMEAGDDDPCANGTTTLKSVSDPSCSVKCSAGSDGAGSAGLFTCHAGGGNPTSNVSCRDVFCDGLQFTQGMVGGTSGLSCKEGMRLSTIKNSTCSIKCNVTAG